MRAKIGITKLLRPYWHWVAIAFVAVLAEGAMDLLEPGARVTGQWFRDANR